MTFLKENIEIITGVMVAFGFIAIMSSIISVFLKVKKSTKKVVKSTLETEREIKTVEQDIQSLRTYIIGAQALNQKLIQRKSPLSLTEEGLNIIKSAKFDQIIEHHFEDILQEMKKLTPQNAYQVEQGLYGVMMSIAQKHGCIRELENASFKVGQRVEILLYLGAVFIRDRVAEKLEVQELEVA